MGDEKWYVVAEARCSCKKRALGQKTSVQSPRASGGGLSGTDLAIELRRPLRANSIAQQLRFANKILVLGSRERRTRVFRRKYSWCIRI